MRRLAAILALLLGLTLLAAPPASAAVAASAENRASGSATAPNNLIGIAARLSESAVKENITLGYDFASDDAVAAREIAEHTRIREITGGVPASKSDAVSNKVDPIGPKRQHLLDGE